MDNQLLRFAELPWNEIAPGAREKAFRYTAFTIRMLELAPGFQEGHWCRRQHVGYVLQGSLIVEFAGHKVIYRQGDGLRIPGGEVGKHRSSVGDEQVVLFLVDPH